MIMRFLALETTTFDAKRERVNANAIRNSQHPQTTFIFFEDAEGLLEAITATRVEIIRLLRNEGPMTAEAIAVRLKRAKLMVGRDLEALLDLEIIDLDIDARYLFEFDGLRICLQFPHPGQTVVRS
jgi:predicted transcriptional regulator